MVLGIERCIVAPALSIALEGAVMSDGQSCNLGKEISQFLQTWFKARKTVSTDRKWFLIYLELNSKYYRVKMASIFSN